MYKKFDFSRFIDIMHDGNIDKLLKDFNQISGMEIALLDNKLHTLFSQKCPIENFCSAIHKSAKCLERCKLSDEECVKKARTSGEPVLYTCPFGIKEAVIPIVQNEKVSAYLLCSLGVENTPDADDFSIEQALETCPTLDKSTLKHAISNIKHCDKKDLSAFFNILTAIGTHVSVNGQFMEQTPTIGELIKRFINQNISRKITLADLSYHIHYSKATLTQHFKKEFGISIVDYMTKKRIELSKKLLLSTDKPLSEISALCGFDDTEYFSRTFKKFNSLPPATWRRENK